MTRLEPRLDELDDLVTRLVSVLESIPVVDRIVAINQVRSAIHQISPFKQEPVDYVAWLPVGDITANDYNPNKVAPPEMELLALSVLEDGYTQPIVTWRDGEGIEVIDGFHRNRVGRENPEITERILGHLPVVVANADRTDRGDRIAATIRHNRARGKHQVGAMADIVQELKKRNWTDKKIGKHLGMEPDEVLRLAQITGLAELFADAEFSQAWEADTIDPERDTIDIELEDVPT